MPDSLSSRQFSPGDVIFQEGEPGDCAYVVEQGRVEIASCYEGKKIFLAFMEKGDIFGEMAIIDGAPRTATAVAVEVTLLTIITHDQINTRIAEADPVLRLLLNVILKRYRGRYLSNGQGTMSVLLDHQMAKTGIDQSDDVLQEQNRVIDRIKLESELREALTNKELVLYYQPIVDLESGYIAGFEALVRWNHPQRGFVPPGLFIPVAEQTSLIVSIGLWIIKESVHSLRLFQDRVAQISPQRQPLFMSVNVSSRQFLEANFLELFTQSIEQAKVDPQQLKLEITETLLMNPEGMQWIERCKANGFTLALDDFGTGYSCLSYLHRLPIDTLKVDKSFVSAMLADPRSMGVVQAVISLAKGLDMEVVAEGIEVPAELQALRQLACNFGQGYLMSKPVTAEAALALLGGAGYQHLLAEPISGLQNC